MSRALAVLAAAALAAAQGGPVAEAPSSGDLVIAPPGADDLGALASGILPPPPTVVVRETSYFGTITIDHAAHLARRARCDGCHDPGPITKILFTPKIAHERCIGCHSQANAGPQKCAGCHVKPPPPPGAVTAAGAAGAPATAPPPAPSPDPANVASALAEFDKPLDFVKSEPFQRYIEFGLTSAATQGTGASVRFASHQDHLVLAQSIDVLRSAHQGRTLVLVGAGRCDPSNPRTQLEATVVAGMDVFDTPVTVVFPAVGVRAGVEWRQPAPFLQNFSASFTCLWDLSTKAYGQEIGGFAAYLGFSAGFKLP